MGWLRPFGLALFGLALFGLALLGGGAASALAEDCSDRGICQNALGDCDYCYQECEEISELCELLPGDPACQACCEVSDRVEGHLSWCGGGSEASHVGGSCEGLHVTQVVCHNLTRDHSVIAIPDSYFDCTEAGMPAQPGDRVAVYCHGNADGSAPVGGSLEGMGDVDLVRCLDLTSGQRRYPSKSPSWDCEASGLGAFPGGRLRMTAVGTVGSQSQSTR